MPDNIDALRWKIEEVDNEIMSLIGQRMRLAKQMGQHKVGKAVPVRNLRVEDQVVARYVSRAKEADITEAAAKRIAHILIRESVDAQFRLPRPVEAKRVTVIGGSGKMGSWLCHFLSSRGHKVLVQDVVSSTKFPFENDLKRAVYNADIIILATPIVKTGEMLDKVMALKPKGVIFDIASIKTPVQERLQAAVKKGYKVCSVHPMFGPEVESLLERNVVICDCGSKEAVREAHYLFDGAGADVVDLPLAEHDPLIAYVLVMSHATNIAFFSALANSGMPHDELDRVSSTTFEKQECTARAVAMENPELYYEIQHLHPETEKVLCLLADALKELTEAAKAEDSGQFVNIMEKGREYYGED